MGVLDEAIRQHLELKRRRGADAGEIKREEDEALGAAAHTGGSSDSDQAVAEQPAQTEAPEPDAEPLDEQIASADQPTAAFDTAELAEALGQVPGEALAEQEAELQTEQHPVAEPEHDDDVSPATEEPVAEEVEEIEEETEDTDAADPPDELEETPEFLEDAPEHDKLWFEQKPPKDFDF